MQIEINKENLIKLSNNYLKVLSDLSRAKEEGCHPNMYIQILYQFSKLREIAVEMEKKLEEKAKVLEKTVDTNNIDTNRS